MKLVDVKVAGVSVLPSYYWDFFEISGDFLLDVFLVCFKDFFKFLSKYFWLFLRIYFECRGCTIVTLPLHTFLDTSLIFLLVCFIFVFDFFDCIFLLFWEVCLKLVDVGDAGGSVLPSHYWHFWRFLWDLFFSLVQR